MKITQLTIGPRNSWDAKSPTICTVKIASEAATVETVLNDDDLNRILDLVQGIVAEAGARNMAAFVDAVRTIDADKPKVLA